MSISFVAFLAILTIICVNGAPSTSTTNSSVTSVSQESNDIRSKKRKAHAEVQAMSNKMWQETARIMNRNKRSLSDDFHNKLNLELVVIVGLIIFAVFILIMFGGFLKKERRHTKLPVEV